MSSSTILLRENDNIVMRLDNDVPGVANTSSSGGDSFPVVHSSASTPGASTSPSADRTTSRTGAARTPRQTAVVPLDPVSRRAAGVPPLVAPEDPPPYSVV